MAGYPTLLEFQFMTADRPQFALGTGTEISDIRIQFTKWVLESRLVRACEEGEDYRFGFNGQEKVNEIAGIGNHMTATFWEYDTRTARRWNIDPVMKPWESPYSVLGGNPILNIDPLGNDWFKNNDGTIKYDPKVKSSKDLEDGQSYLGSVYNEKTKKGNANYREDGSIMFSNETDAYNRMWNVSKQPGG